MLRATKRSIMQEGGRVSREGGDVSYTRIESGQPWAKLGKAAGVKAWMDGVPFDGKMIDQLKRVRSINGSANCPAGNRGGIAR